MAHPADLPVGELIVQNGKRKGTRLTLRPVTVIGSAGGCDIRLSGDGVAPVHCVIALSPEGPALKAGFSGPTLVNGEPRDDAPLADGDEIKVGPCVFQIAWSAPVPPVPPVPPPSEALAAEAAQLAEILDDRQQQLADHEQQLVDARAAFRLERDRFESERDEAERLKQEANELHREAKRHRDRIKRLAAKFVGRMRRKSHATRKELAAEKARLDETRSRLSAEIADFSVIRSAFHTDAAEARDRLRDGWAAIDAQQQRAAAERAEANNYFAKQESALDVRAAELTGREKTISEARATLERETDTLRKEAAGLEARIQNARTVVEELEKKRDQLRAVALAPVAQKEPPVPVRVSLDRAKDRDLTAWAAELDAREQRLADDRAALAEVKAGLDQDALDLADRRRVLAEQVGLLAAARSQWQQAEARTLAEMEDLAHDLRHREQQLDAREERLIQADTRRREDAYELWQFRLKLEGWQAKLTAVERRWHAERELREAAYAGRVHTLGLREAAIEGTFARWEQAREQEAERLRAELESWADDRGRLARAAAEFDRQRQEVLGELVTHASRAMAAEELVAGAVQDGGSGRVNRRLEVLRKRWERVFGRARDEAAERQSAAAGEMSAVEQRYQELLRLLTDVTNREVALSGRTARAEYEALAPA
ncbi:MAG TPA: FHA domain-containing protein, partial [Gemmataceae bacterium]|nr:FHA domain-containing protein [Gemmataceae bacterium]